MSNKFKFMTDEAEKEACRRGMEYAWNSIESGKYDMIILDEINCVLNKGLIPLGNIVKMIREKGNIELVLTGQGAPKALEEYGDYFTNLQKIRHPWDKGIKARKGIEY